MRRFFSRPLRGLPAADELRAAVAVGEWAAHAANQYQVFPNVTYLTASNYEAKIDIYARRGATTPQPTVIYFHGGFWAAGSKEASLMSLMPWLEMGWTVVNVEYRLARVALAPAAVEDCLCALRFIAAQAKTYNIDTARIVLTGESAGGHLTLTTGMIPESSGLARECAGTTPIPRVAAMINWFGITDVADVIDGPHAANLAVTWLGSLPNKDEIAKRVSPLTWVQARAAADPDDSRRSGSARAVRRGGAAARRAGKAGVTNQLLTIPGGSHGNFTPEERTKIFATIREFLAKNGLGENK